MSDRRRGILGHVTPVQEVGATRVSQVRPDEDPQTQSVQPVRDIHKTETFTLFTTQIGVSKLWYNAESWVKVILRLETAGPVSVGTRQELTPVLSGKGILLSDEDIEFELDKGNRLFYAAESVNRVRVVITPIPYGRSIVQNQEVGYDRITQAVVDVKNALIGGARRIAQPSAPQGIIPTRRRRK